MTTPGPLTANLELKKEEQDEDVFEEDGEDAPFTPTWEKSVHEPGVDLNSSLTTIDWLASVTPRGKATGDEKPDHSYATLITMAISAASNGQKLTLKGIYDYVVEKFAYYRKCKGQNWKNSIRHNLSLSSKFTKVARERDDPGKGSYWTLAPAIDGEKQKEKRKKKRRTSSVMSERADDVDPTDTGGRRRLSSSSSVSDAKMQPPTPTSATSFAGVDVSSAQLGIAAQHLAQMSAGVHGMVPSVAGTFPMMQPTAVNQMAALLQQVSTQGVTAAPQITQQQIAYLMQQQQHQNAMQQRMQHTMAGSGPAQNIAGLSNVLAAAGAMVTAAAAAAESPAAASITASVVSQLARAQSSQLIQQDQLPISGTPSPTAVVSTVGTSAGAAIPEHVATTPAALGGQDPNKTLFTVFQKYLVPKGQGPLSSVPAAVPIGSQPVAASMGPPSSSFLPPQSQPTPIVPDASRSRSGIGQAAAVGSNRTAAAAGSSSTGDALPIDFLNPDISFDMLQVFLDNPEKDSQRASLLASFNAGQLGETRDLLKQCQEEFKATSIGSLKASSFNDSTTFRNFSASFNQMLATAPPVSGQTNTNNDDDDEHAFDWDSIT